ncbi:MAG TPA: NUDIX domain-containing protein [Clostridia bacterium]|nr:NUDIX domain-containing protein [Clostridia bacterium]
MGERFKNSSAVMLMLMRKAEKGEEILLQKRKNTGYCDGFYDFSAVGHVEANESMKMAIIREAKEELNIDIDIDNIDFVTIIHKFDNGRIYYNGYFKVIDWKGVPLINEQDKIEELKWININCVKNIINDREQAIHNYKNNIKYSEFGWVY